MGETAQPAKVASHTSEAGQREVARSVGENWHRAGTADGDVAGEIASGATGEMANGETDQGRAPSHRRLALLWTALVAALVLHNLEELLFDMAGWFARQPRLPGSVLYENAAQFAMALLVVTVAVTVLAGIAVAVRPAWSAEVLVGLAYALMINAGSHLALSVVSWSLMPGVITGVVILVPLGRYVVRSVPPVPWTTAAVATTAIAALAFVFGSHGVAALITSLG